MCYLMSLSSLAEYRTIRQTELVEEIAVEMIVLITQTKLMYIRHFYHWRPGALSVISSDPLSKEDTNTREHPNNCRPGEAQLWSDNMNGCPYGSSSNQYSLTQIKPSPPNTILPNYQISNMSLSTSKSQIHLRPYQSPKTDSVRIVRLAPDLTPVNLPRLFI